jgi:hypothetical protein
MQKPIILINNNYILTIMNIKSRLIISLKSYLNLKYETLKFNIIH